MVKETGLPLEVMRFGVAVALCLGAGPSLLAAGTVDAASPNGRLRSSVAWRHYNQTESRWLVPLLKEAIAFQTVGGNAAELDKQRAWLTKVAGELGLTVRDAGLITEIELPGPPGAPVLGLLVHGDVQAAEASWWSSPPFAGELRDGEVWGRGAADDKGPLIQALLAMKALAASSLPRTHSIRLLVGSDEESTNKDITTYLKDHPAPDYSLVLDSAFPLVVGEKAWNSLTVSADPGERDGKPEDLPYTIAKAQAGLATSIVPDEARLSLKWKRGAPDWEPVMRRFRSKELSEGTRLHLDATGADLSVMVSGHSAHAGANLEVGRNALVGLARVCEGEVPSSGVGDLLAFAAMAGEDIYGTGLEISDRDPVWGRYAVNVATLKPGENGRLDLTINVRRIPPRTGPELKAHLERVVAAFNARTGARLLPSGFYDDEPLIFALDAPLIRRLQAIYARTTGRADAPIVSGGATYAKRLPNAIAFGMWFPGKPYPGHDVDEHIAVADLNLGVHVLLEALADLASGPRVVDPFGALSP